MGLIIRGGLGLVAVIVSAAAWVDGSIPSYGADRAGDRRGLPYSPPRGRPVGNVVWFVLVLSELSACGALGVSDWLIFLGDPGRPVAALVHGLQFVIFGKWTHFYLCFKHSLSLSLSPSSNRIHLQVTVLPLNSSYSFFIYT